MSQQYLVCESYEHADLVDHLVMAKLRDEDGNLGSSWSGVFTDGVRYGILWAAPVSSLFGALEDNPSMEVVDEIYSEDGTSDWKLVVLETEQT